MISALQRVFASAPRFILAALASNAAGYACFAALIAINPRHPVGDFLLATTLAFPMSFYLNRVWVFGSNRYLPREISKFLTVYVSAGVVGAWLLGRLLSVIPNAYLAQAVSMSLIGATTLFLHTLWTFTHRN